MAMGWEEIAEARMREISRLRAIVRNSTSNDFIIEKASDIYFESQSMMEALRARKPDVRAPLDSLELKLLFTKLAISEFIVALGIMGPLDFEKHIESRGKRDDV